MKMPNLDTVPTNDHEDLAIHLLNFAYRNTMHRFVPRPYGLYLLHGGYNFLERMVTLRSDRCAFGNRRPESVAAIHIEFDVPYEWRPHVKWLHGFSEGRIICPLLHFLVAFVRDPGCESRTKLININYQPRGVEDFTDNYVGFGALLNCITSPYPVARNRSVS